MVSIPPKRPIGATSEVSSVPETTNSHEARELVLKDPGLAAFLAWLVPGLGHVYQGRTAKGVLFFVCLMGTFAYGCYLGGSRETGWARVVYAAWDEDDTRLPFLCQIGIGLPVMPALVQASRVHNNKAPILNGFMAPPRQADRGVGPTLDELHQKLHTYFELGTVYTMIAGLLNILAIYDAWAGPVFPEPDKKDDEDEPEAAKTPSGPSGDQGVNG
jgi:hypothetical protein